MIAQGKEGGDNRQEAKEGVIHEKLGEEEEEEAGKEETRRSEYLAYFFHREGGSTIALL